MCGILGTIPSTEVNFFKKSLDTLFHRGPDDFGMECIDNEISLGHRRLTIVDLSENGHQPMFDISKRYSIVFNGEIYNFIEIKNELKKKGYAFRSSSDTEVLLNAYIEWGAQCVLRFNGMWSFAIWDRLKKELFLSRDRFGKKHLFYAYIENKLIFASEMKAIYPFLKKMAPSKDFHWMKNNLFNYEGTEKCLIEGIKRFPYGYNGIFKNGKLSLNRYWNTLDHLEIIPSSYEEQVEKFRELFLDSCKLRMRTEVPIGATLSGGLDSSSIVSAMAENSNNNLDYSSKDWKHAFVASFPGKSLDETNYAKKIIDSNGLDAKYINVNPLKCWDKIEEYFYMFDELYLTSPVPMIMTYGAVKNNGVKVTLDGHGADEMFSGYGHILEAIMDCGINIKKIKEILDIYVGTIEGFDNMKKVNKIEMVSTFLMKKAAKKLIGRGLKSIDSSHENYRKLDNFSKHLYVLFHETTMPTLLRNYDRYSMMNSVENRMPFMDHRIVSYIHSLPYSSKFGDGYTKKLMRDAMSPYMPDEITWRKPKIGFNSPIVDWIQGDLKEWFLDTVHEQSFLESELVDNPSQLQLDIIKIANKTNNMFFHGEMAWKKLTPHIWEKSVIKRAY